ncbi:hypothetical protein BPOR_0341g00110 [Botrytis porri]|uniref:Heterokaryon incompatibility domain-containing protein n=1 Tax=Botrytis porri TaxID=87229 RepID=A0A4Z1KKM8_9HELO|nr:hypothetical protein BPOR_0341g00110 [Botrytis porri]
MPPTFLKTLNMLCKVCDRLNVTDLLKRAKAKSYQPKFIGDARIGRFMIDDDLASDANFNIARGWMNTCILEHPESKCPSFEDEVLPSRVIDVGLENTNPSLLMTHGFRGKYIALSHCWGGRIETILKTSNLKSLQKGITMTSLPADFRDAILITRALGFQFLWIDSLRIIQDSKYGWGIESKKMGGIYRNSALTIGAAAAHRAADGMLHPRSQTLRVMKPKLKLSKDSGSDDAVEIARSTALSSEYLATLFESGPLQSRAWAFQERMLSPRILWYGRRQIYWQCLCGFRSADGALSGVGIWSKLFRENLLWHGPMRIASHTKQYRAPSWSWAVTDEGSGLFYNNLSRLTSTPHDPILLSHHIELSSENPYGAVKYAHIIVDTLTLKLVHLGKYKNPSNETNFFFIFNWIQDNELSFTFPRIFGEEEGEIKITSGGSVTSIPTKTGFIHLKLQSFPHTIRWDRESPNWSKVSPLKYKVMFVGFEQQLKKYVDSTAQDPEDAKVCKRVGQLELGFFDRETEDPDLNAWLASDWWKRETLKLI